MKKHHRTLASCALLLLFGCDELPSFPTAPAELTSGVAVFEHADYAGESALITEDQKNLKEVRRGLRGSVRRRRHWGGRLERLHLVGARCSWMASCPVPRRWVQG